MLFIELVLSASASLRCASNTINIILSSFQLPFSSPSWYTGRLWLLRIGYHKLTRAKEYADDWVWIIDHTVQLGAEKCLVVLGVRLVHLPKRGTCLNHEHVEPIELLPVKKSNGDIVFQQLENITKKTGIPREIIGDHGSDIKSGIEKFCQKHQETCYIYDIKHKSAAVLKKELHNDDVWCEFIKLAAETKKKVQQTSLAPLGPCNQRSKSRYMNADMLIRWGENMLTFLGNTEKMKTGKFCPKEVEEKCGWVNNFREPLKEWSNLLQVITTTEDFVRSNGIYHDCNFELEKLLEPTNSERVEKVSAQLLDFVAKESSKSKPNERLLGSSEVIESVFGKAKRIEQNQAKSGFTGLLLSIPAMLSTTTKDVVQKAMETVPTQKALEWCKKTIGKSVQAKRVEAFDSS